MRLDVKIETSYEVPEGTVLSENGQEFILPDGNVLKVWAVVEDHRKGEDLDEADLNKLGVAEDIAFERTMELIGG